MKELPVSMILCALLSTNAVFAQSSEKFSGVIRETTPESYRADHPYTKEWEMIKEEDVAWKKRVWRTIDLSDKGNDLLALTSIHPSIGDVLLNGLYNGEIESNKVYTTDRFEKELPPGNIKSLKDQGLTGNMVTSLQIKEDWIMLKKDNKMVVRIVAMAPVVKENGTDYPAFWLYYPDARGYLSKQQVAAPGSGPSNLDEVFEGRFFSSKIDKTSEAMAPPAKDPGKKW